MRIISILILLAFMGYTVWLADYSKRPELHPAETHVLDMTVYGLTGGIIINTLCALFARTIDPEVAPGTEILSCSPFGVGTAAIVARSQVFATGGWSRLEWAYVKIMPSTTTKALLVDLRELSGILGLELGVKDGVDDSRGEL
ncbi:uncharacterized protein BCR38DRAFT_416511 [Pseudomassariella vexata]|uniref:Uncharacterized protein n=1 Tax=Pseudomassariella vexata TaxID=1141098 RepID=A0A1Y2EKG8_9PEZI|nr:uncharacterized protein BCR38DRAFT_416511 [Pseudomassariella vexata]ORY71345.1 hypothetical protein BCR38DRAFT_416511 [Pseudomassariella vexata]